MADIAPKQIGFETGWNCFFEFFVDDRRLVVFGYDVEKGSRDGHVAGVINLKIPMRKYIDQISDYEYLVKKIGCAIKFSGSVRDAENKIRVTEFNGAGTIDNCTFSVSQDESGPVIVSFPIIIGNLNL